MHIIDNTVIYIKLHISAMKPTLHPSRPKMLRQLRPWPGGAMVAKSASVGRWFIGTNMEVS